MVQTRKEQINILRAFWSKYTYIATGGASSDNIAGATLNAASVTGTDGGETSTPTRGIVTTGASNLVRLRTESDGYYIFDDTNDLIFGRLTYSAPNYVVSYYKISGGSEISTTLPGSIGNIEMLYPEVMNFGEIPANAHIIDEAGFGFQDTTIGGGGGGGGGSLTPPNNPADDNKVAYASGGDLAYATNVLTDGSYVSIGTNPASAGLLRLSNNDTITARNNADSGDVSLLTLNTSDQTEIQDGYMIVDDDHVSIAGGVGTVAATGELRLPYKDVLSNGGIYFRNNADNGDIQALSVGPSGRVYLGGTTSQGVTYVNGSPLIRLTIVGVTVAEFGNTVNGFKLYDTDIVWDDDIASPILFQEDETANSTNGQTLTIQAQNATGTTSDGGDLVLTSGTGTNDDGYVYIQNGGTNTVEIGSGNVTINGKLTVTGLIDPTGLQLDPQGSSPANNSIWIENTSPTVLKFTDSVGSTITLGSGAGGLTPPNDPADDNKIAYASGGDLAYATNVLTDGSYVSIGTNPASAGLLRLSNNNSIMARDNSNANNIQLVATDASDNILLGDQSNGANVYLDVPPSGNFDVRIGAVDVISVDDTPSITLGTTAASSGTIRLENAATITARNNADSADIVIANLSAIDEVEVRDGTLKVGSTFASIGTNPAGAGVLRIPNNNSIQARNAANSGNVSLLTLNTSDQTEIQDGNMIVDSDYVSIAGGVGTVASTGELRLPHKDVTSNGGIYFRNNADNGDIQALSVGPSGRVYLGGTTSQGVTYVNGSPLIRLTIVGVPVAEFGNTVNGFKLYDTDIVWDDDIASPILFQEDETANSTNGQTLTIQAQNATGTTSDGGDLVLTSGTGTNDDGYVFIQSGGTDVGAFGPNDAIFYNDTTIFGKLTVTGLIDPTGLQLDPQASSPANNAIWVSTDSPTELKFTNSAGSTITLGSGAGGLTPPANPADDGKLAYASTGDLAYSGITTDGDNLSFASTNATPQLSQTDVAGSDAVDMLIQAQSATGSSVSGGNLLLRGGTGGSSGTGGDCSGGGVVIFGRDGFAPGGNVASDGGGISLLAGDGDAVGAASIGADGRGGSITLSAGNATTSGTLSAGVKGGDINVSSGDGVAGAGQAGDGGDVDINTGFGDVNGSGGDFTASCGEGGSNGAGGVMVFTAGNGGLSGGAAGSITLNGGTGQNTNGAGGSIFINSGPAGGGGASDGIIALDVDDSGSGDAEIQLRIQGTTWMYLTSNKNSRHEILFSNSVTNPTIAVDTVSASNAQTLSILGQAVTGSGDLSGGDIDITATNASSSSSGASATGGDVSITCGAGSASGNVKSNGGDFTVIAGDGAIRSGGSIGTDSGRGGNVELYAGNATDAGGATLVSGASGGSVIILAGEGIAGSGQSGSGGTVSITSGAGSVNGAGGTLSLTAGNGGSSGDGGSIEILGGNTNGTSNIGGNITITAGANSSNNDGGGVVTITGGAGDSATNGGQVNITAGEQTGLGASVNITGGASSSSGNAGDVNLTGGTPTSGAGGDIRLTSASGAGTNQNAGNIILQLGSGTGTGNDGVVYLESASGIVMTESAAAPSNSLVGSATRGTLWVRNDTPCVLIFTDDAGTDHEIAFV